MKSKIFIIVLFVALAGAVKSFGGEIVIKEDFSKAPAKISSWENRWELKDEAIRTKDGLKAYSSLLMGNLNLELNRTTLSFKVRQNQLDPKGSLFGVKLNAGRGNQLHLFYQNGLMRCIQTVEGKKSETENFGRLVSPLTEGKDAPWTEITFDIADSAIKSKVNGQDVGSIALKKEWNISLPITELDFHAYQADVSFDDLSVVSAESTIKVEAQPSDKILSQMDVAEKQAAAKGPNDYRILFIGDSITRHGFSKKTVSEMGWDHLAGMAATKEENDYAHLLAAKIQKLMPDKKVDLQFHGKGGSGSAAQRLSAITEFANIAADLVVVQLGEHEKEAVGADALESSYKKLLEAIRAWPSKPLVICTGVWNPYKAGERTVYTEWTRKVEDTMQGVCKNMSIPFASVEKYALDPSCSGWGTSGGVKWHPNDKGMQGYSDAIFAAFEESRKK